MDNTKDISDLFSVSIGIIFILSFVLCFVTSMLIFQYHRLEDLRVTHAKLPWTSVMKAFLLTVFIMAFLGTFIMLLVYAS